VPRAKIYLLGVCLTAPDLSDYLPRRATNDRL